MSPKTLDPEGAPSTSAVGAMRAKHPLRGGLIVGLSIVSTSAQSASFAEGPPGGAADHWTIGTCASIAKEFVAVRANVRTAISELRCISGLTWEQLARVFGVSRRTLHFWASGKSINATNEQHLRKLLKTLLRADRGSASSNRAMLLHDQNGVSPIDLLVACQYAEFLQLVGEGCGRKVTRLIPLSEESQEARRPQSPVDLVDALQDRVHRDVGRGRAARTARSKRSGPKRG